MARRASFSWETEVARRDLKLGVTTIAGLAGPRVRSVNVAVRGRARTLPIAGGAFLGVLRGDVAPSELPVTARYGNGQARTFAPRPDPWASRDLDDHSSAGARRLGHRRTGALGPPPARGK